MKGGAGRECAEMSKACVVSVRSNGRVQGLNSRTTASLLGLVGCLRLMACAHTARTSLFSPSLE